MIDVSKVSSSLPYQVENRKFELSVTRSRLLISAQNEALNCPFLQELNHPELTRAVRTYFTIAREMKKRPYYTQANYDNFVQTEEPVHPSFRVLYVAKPPIARENNDFQETAHQKNSCMCTIM